MTDTRTALVAALRQEMADLDLEIDALDRRRAALLRRARAGMLDDLGFDDIDFCEAMRAAARQKWQEKCTLALAMNEQSIALLQTSNVRPRLQEMVN